MSRGVFATRSYAEEISVFSEQTGKVTCGVISWGYAAP